MHDDSTSNTPIWRPSATRAAASNMRRFITAYRRQLEGEDYTDLYRWSITEPARFWEAVLEFCGLQLATKHDAVVENFEALPSARWFDGATLNFAANLLRHGHQGPAIIAYDERGRRSELGRDELRHEVARIARMLESFGVGPGDRVAGLLPNCPETVIAMLAAASLGAVWSACSPDFGTDAVLQRFAQIGPKVLFAVDGYAYNGRRIDCLHKTRAIAAELKLSAIVVVAFAGAERALDGLERAHRFTDAAGLPAEERYDPMPFSHPLYIMYSSGTTGAPKCIVHGAGGTLIQHQKEHVLHTDIKPGDVVFFFTTCGWMMWHWLVSSLASGATILLYDGSPFHPDPGMLWRIAETEKVNVFGTSAGYLSALEKAGYQPRQHAELRGLNSILSTGSPLLPSSYDYVYRSVKDDVQLASISGGTDLISCFALGNPLLPIYRGELQCRGLGMKVEIFDDQGRSVTEQKGQLVCTAPFPSMPVGFWNDPEGRAYRAAYFSRYPNVWWHGDYAELTAHGGVVIYGRSDTVLNPGGVRIGTAEIYRVVEQFDEIAESVAVGQEHGDGERIVLFVRLQPGYALDDALRERLRDSMRRQASPRHVPARILAVADLPRTINGKVVELAVRDVIHGRAVDNEGVLVNPEALDDFRNRAELAD